MKIVIIEDEKLTAEDLADMICREEAETEVVAWLKSVRESVAYFNSHKAPDLIFCDIHLSDGLSFEIFKQLDLPVPVIFCTAYDEYAMNAFRTNGIDYILKPFSQVSIAQALHKYHKLRQNFSAQADAYHSVFDLFISRTSQKTSSILINYKDKIIPVKTDHIAAFYIEFEETRLLTFEHKIYTVNKSLEELDKLSGAGFFRINRQFLVNRKAIKDASHSFSRKLVVNLNVPFELPITVSKERIPIFLDWLADH